MRRCGYAEGVERIFRSLSASLSQQRPERKAFRKSLLPVESGIAETYSERNLRLPSCRLPWSSHLSAKS